MKPTGARRSRRSAAPASLAQLEAVVLANPRAWRAFNEQKMALATALLVRDMRQGANLSQARLAGLLGMKQQSLARVECGEGLLDSTLELLSRTATACDKQLIIGFVAKTVARRLIEEVNRKGGAFLIAL